MTHAKWRRPLALSGLVLLLALCGGCEDDEGLGLDASCVAFIPDSVPTPGEVVAQVGADSSCEIVIIELIVTGVDDIWGASFEPIYPGGTVLISQDIDLEGSFLGEDAFQELVELSPGVAEAGITRVDNRVNTGVTPDDDNNLLARFAFLRIAASGSGPLTFEDANLSTVAGLGEPVMLEDPPTVFRGGTLSIVNQVP